MDMEASSTYMISYTTLLLQSQLSIIKQEARYSIATCNRWGEVLRDRSKPKTIQKLECHISFPVRWLVSFLVGCVLQKLLTTQKKVWCRKN